MIHRTRMARKRLMVARERENSANEVWLNQFKQPNGHVTVPAWERSARRQVALRAIERRKDRTC